MTGCRGWENSQGGFYLVQFEIMVLQGPIGKKSYAFPTVHTLRSRTRAIICLKCHRHCDSALPASPPRRSVQGLGGTWETIGLDPFSQCGVLMPGDQIGHSA